MGEMERPMTDHYTEATELIRGLLVDLPTEGSSPSPKSTPHSHSLNSSE